MRSVAEFGYLVSALRKVKLGAETMNLYNTENPMAFIAFTSRQYTTHAIPNNSIDLK